MEYTQSVGRGGLVKARTGAEVRHQLVGEGRSRPGLDCGVHTISW